MDNIKKYYFKRQPIRHTNLSVDLTPAEKRKQSRTSVGNVNSKNTTQHNKNKKKGFF